MNAPKLRTYLNASSNAQFSLFGTKVYVACIHLLFRQSRKNRSIDSPNGLNRRQLTRFEHIQLRSAHFMPVAIRID